MDKLKTLKDLETEKPEGDRARFVFMYILKQEAIKDIKFLRECRTITNCCDEQKIREYFKYGDCMACSEGCGMCGTEAIEEYIKWKFNISEEDLK